MLLATCHSLNVELLEPSTTLIDFFVFAPTNIQILIDRQAVRIRTVCSEMIDQNLFAIDRLKQTEKYLWYFFLYAKRTN